MYEYIGPTVLWRDEVVGQIASLAQAEETQHREDDDDRVNQPDDIVHDKLLPQFQVLQE
ncbi:hypothetical protein AM571_PA00170 (plasmid) [Rhizobium etli 8C-3]|uniref:Uncharacterized protein n=1 Tax=Rhizobium etli 8C-3 TaxID=538025 RepID=A0A1L5PAC6_RHIET|nr:hypothetical protein [Rhizobium etli]APO77056.1 hypothetical protein AM571_PA00170 [Rhizobium etli 8C-3]